MKMQVAIIGTPGSGKTILTAVLSRYLAGQHDKVFMRPAAAYVHIGNSVETKSTNECISNVIEPLHNGQWPTGTEGDKKYELGFDLKIGGNTYEMQLLDSAGEDLKAIGTIYDRTQLSAFQQKLHEYLISSNAVIIIVNLGDFADAPSIKKRDEAENTLQELVDNLVKAGTCHHILICFTAYDKYRNTIDQYKGTDDKPSCEEYLRRELPMLYHACEEAGRKVVLDYTKYDSSLIKRCDVQLQVVSSVIEEKPAPGINPDRFGKPPVGFDVRNETHSYGMNLIADWLLKCERETKRWANIENDVASENNRSEIIRYWILPSVVGMILGFFGMTGGLFMYRVCIGAVAGFLAGDMLKLFIAKKDGFIFKKNNRNGVELQKKAIFIGMALGLIFGSHCYELYSSLFLVYAGGIGAGMGLIAGYMCNRFIITGNGEIIFNRKDGSGGGQSASPPTDTGETAPPRPSGTGGASASGGTETFD